MANNDNDFMDSFSQLFGGKSSNKSNCDTCGYKAYSDKINKIKKMMIDCKNVAIKANTKLEYLELVEKCFNKVAKEIK